MERHFTLQPAKKRRVTKLSTTHKKFKMEIITELIIKSFGFVLVSRSQAFRLTAEGPGTLAAFNGQGPPKRPYD